MVKKCWKNQLVLLEKKEYQSFSWLPEKEGEIEFEIILGKVSGETYKDNNTKKITTRVENKTIRALIVDSFPRWEYRFLRNALNRDLV